MILFKRPHKLRLFGPLIGQARYNDKGENYADVGDVTIDVCRNMESCLGGGQTPGMSSAEKMHHASQGR